MLESYNLRKVKGVIPNGVKDKILKFVHNSKQIFAERSHLVDKGLQKGLQAVPILRIERTKVSAEPILVQSQKTHVERTGFHKFVDVTAPVL
jgi:hypothetical protein